jgi:hypothetical protein
MLVSIVSGATAAGLQFALGMAFLSPPAANAAWQRETEVKLVIFGTCFAGFSAMYSVAKWVYPLPRTSREYKEFCMATRAHMALLHVGSVGCIVFAVGAGIWGAGLSVPALLLGLFLMPFALYELYRAWYEERLHLRSMRCSPTHQSPNERPG